MKRVKKGRKTPLRKLKGEKGRLCPAEVLDEPANSDGPDTRKEVESQNAFEECHDHGPRFVIAVSR